MGLILSLGLHGIPQVWAQVSAPEPIDSPLHAMAPLGQSLTVAVWPTAREFGWDESLWAERSAMVTAIDHSLSYLATPAAVTAYRDYPVAGVNRDRVIRSLRRFRALLQVSPSPAAFYQAVQREFTLYQAVGNDGLGTVHFTGYFEPTFQASRTPTATYRYPLYRRPPSLDNWSLPHPTRLALEGQDGLAAAQGPLAGLELVWLRDRLEAFLVQVQGSARLQLTDGSFFSVGYAGRTEYPYTSLGRELINDGKIPAAELTLDRLLAHFQAHPGDLSAYIPRNDRFVFFRQTDGGPPTGSLSVPVTAGRSIATDKSLMPPGALALVSLNWPERNLEGTWSHRPMRRYVLDQDTGGAILGPGRVDIFVGTGTAAGEQAGQVNTNGALYYLLLRS
ncbi:murein transglycosylase A [Leptolyngbya sp. PCC 6406]|uniref:murein transglycosylase A n=1 Tax=Leptolyngbya sp. PCC 6406 TaxID=1173264 RepID=UPI000305A048|nr:MltA domain-containing protein [Leptolyngbya sp. PCC 6406]